MSANYVHLIARWLNDNSSALGVVATIFIAGVSALSALIIRSRKRKADCKPVLIFIEEIEQGEPSYNRALYVKNTGHGLALNIVRRIDNDPLAILRSDETLLLSSLSPGDSAFAFYRTFPSNSAVPILDNPQFHATVEC